MFGFQMLGSFFIGGKSMTKNAASVYEYLNAEKINYQIVTHPPVYTAEQADKYVQKYEFARTKNLFLKNKAGYYLVTILENKRLDMKKLKENLSTSRFSFAYPEELITKLGITSGAVSPFNLFNDKHHQITFIIDADILKNEKLIGCHPNDNTATVILGIKDLLQIIKQNGNPVKAVQL